MGELIYGGVVHVFDREEKTWLLQTSFPAHHTVLGFSRRLMSGVSLRCPHLSIQSSKSIFN